MAPTALNNYKAKYERNARNFKPDGRTRAAEAADTARPNLWTAARGGKRRRRRQRRLPRREVGMTDRDRDRYRHLSGVRISNLA